jgi:hypothetical protein
MHHEHEIIHERVAVYLHEAGFSPMKGACSERVAMHRDGVYASLAIQYESLTNVVCLAVTFSQDKPKRGIFRNGRGDLRIFVEPAALFGLLCWITSSHDDLLPHDADAWLAQIVALCPQTYAVLAFRDGLETVALVASTDPRESLH